MREVAKRTRKNNNYLTAFASSVTSSLRLCEKFHAKTQSFATTLHDLPLSGSGSERFFNILL